MTIDGGLQTLEMDLPAVITADLRLNKPRYASLPNIMKAKKKPIDGRPIGDFGVDSAPRLRIVRTDEPAARAAGVRVASFEELLDALRSRAGLL